MKKIAILAGTRPEVIKLAPIIWELKKHDDLETFFITTGQHKELLTKALATFDLTPDQSLDVMHEGNQSLAKLSSNLFLEVDKIFEKAKFDFVIVQGDTMTAKVGAECAFFRHIPCGHIEAGLRTESILEPFPEEYNRRAISLISTLHFAPTENARKTLLQEGQDKDAIFVCGNTVIDALYWLIKNKDIQANISKDILSTKRKIILVTAHRRENIAKINDICQAIKQISAEFSNDVLFILPLHLNPQVKDQIIANLQNVANVLLLPPLAYEDLVAYMKLSFLILTDSGGIQEEAPSLNKPVLVLRNSTERMEGVMAGCSKLIGTKVENIVMNVREMLLDEEKYQSMVSIANPYGDGQAALRIVKIIAQFLHKHTV